MLRCTPSAKHSGCGGLVRVQSCALPRRFSAIHIQVRCAQQSTSLMQNLAGPLTERTQSPHDALSLGRVRLPISVIVPVRNEARNLPACLESLHGVGEVYVVDSGSTDETSQIAHSFGAHVVQFHYHGGWPKKRQWALDTLPLSYDWVLLIDADEVLTPELAEEIKHEIQNSRLHGYYIALRMHFLGRALRHSGASFYKLSLF